MMERKSADAKFLDGLMPTHIDSGPRTPVHVGALDSLQEGVDFRKLDLYAAFNIEREDGGDPYLRRYVERLRSNNGSRTVYAGASFFLFTPPRILKFINASRKRVQPEYRGEMWAEVRARVFRAEAY